jgi:DnaA family protein
MQQLTLDIALHDGFRFESFYTHRENVDVVNLLRQIALDQQHGQFFFWGDKQVGKSHLLQACCQRASMAGYITSYLPLKLLSKHGTYCLKGLTQTALIAIDDVDCVLTKPVWEEALFHLINETRQNEQTLLIGASKSPRHLKVRLPDLASRLLWGASYQIHALSDQDKFLALQHRARQRGFEIPDHVITYLHNHYPSELDTLIHLLNRMDKKSLSMGRKITIPLIKETLTQHYLDNK